MIRSGNAKRAIVGTLTMKRDQALAAFVRWMLSKPAVQREVADAFDGATPMCAVLRGAIHGELDGVRVNADDVEGLDRYVNDAVEQSLSSIDCDDIKGLDRFVEEIVTSGDAADELTKAVTENIIEKLR